MVLIDSVNSVNTKAQIGIHLHADAKRDARGWLQGTEARSLL
jgi:hypothetical protein